MARAKNRKQARSAKAAALPAPLPSPPRPPPRVNPEGAASCSTEWVHNLLDDVGHGGTIKKKSQRLAQLFKQRVKGDLCSKAKDVLRCLEGPCIKKKGARVIPKRFRSKSGRENVERALDELLCGKLKRTALKPAHAPAGPAALPAPARPKGGRAPGRPARSPAPALPKRGRARGRPAASSAPARPESGRAPAPPKANPASTRPKGGRASGRRPAAGPAPARPNADPAQDGSAPALAPARPAADPSPGRPPAPACLAPDPAPDHPPAPASPAAYPAPACLVADPAPDPPTAQDLPPAPARPAADLAHDHPPAPDHPPALAHPMAKPAPDNPAAPVCLAADPAPDHPPALGHLPTPARSVVDLEPDHPPAPATPAAGSAPDHPPAPDQPPAPARPAVATEPPGAAPDRPAGRSILSALAPEFRPAALLPQVASTRAAAPWWRVTSQAAAYQKVASLSRASPPVAQWTKGILPSQRMYFQAPATTLVPLQVPTASTQFSKLGPGFGYPYAVKPADFLPASVARRYGCASRPLPTHNRNPQVQRAPITSQELQPPSKVGTFGPSASAMVLGKGHGGLAPQTTGYAQGPKRSNGGPVRPAAKIRLVLPTTDSEDLLSATFASNKYDELFICNQSVRICLICPLSGVRMQVPVRLKNCRHLQTFDCDSVQAMHRARPLKQCPLCNEPFNLGWLVEDGLTERLLGVVPGNHAEIDRHGKLTNWSLSKTSKKWKSEEFIVID